MPTLYIAGDIHLTDGGGPFAVWLDRLAQQPPAHLVILGDLFDFWLDGGACVARHAEVLARLRGLRAAGWQLDLVRGNREIAAGRRLEIATGARLRWPKLDVQLGPTRIRIVHGDRLCHDPEYRLFSAWLRSFWHRGWQTAHPEVVQETVARMIRSRSRKLGRQRVAGRKPRVFIDPRRVVAAARGVDVLIAGHIHESWRRAVRDVDMILVGDWPGTTGHWVEGYADGRVERRNAEFST